MKPPLSGSQNFSAGSPLLDGHYPRLLALAWRWERDRGRRPEPPAAEKAHGPAVGTSDPPDRLTPAMRAAADELYRTVAEGMREPQ